MRGAGQIAELAAVAEPDVGVIVSVGPVHLELLGTIEAIAAAKAELIAGLEALWDRGRTRRRAAARAALARRPTDRSRSENRETFGSLRSRRTRGGDRSARALGRARGAVPPVASARATCCAAAAAALAVGVTPSGRRGARAHRGSRSARGPARRRDLDRWLLQRQPACRCVPPSRTWPRPPSGPPAPARWPCSATCASSGRASATSTSSSARRPPGPAWSYWSRSGRSPPPWPNASTARSVPCRTPPPRPTSCPSSCGPATWCWSRARSRWASRPFAAHCQPDLQAGSATVAGGA